MPHDSNNGLPTGNAVHRALTVCKEFDKTSPALQGPHPRRATQNVEIKWYRIKPDGKQEQYFTHKMEDAIIVLLSPI